MAKEIREMEKKNASSPARMTSCETKGKENGRGNGTKTQRYNKTRREPPQCRNPPDLYSTQSRRPLPQKSKSLDKRPRNRGLPASRHNEVTVAQRAEFGSALPEGPKKINVNHLINFTLTPREAEDKWGGWRNKTRFIHRHPHYHKEQFLQANCQFVVKASGDYTLHCIDPDSLVDWDMIEQVRMLGHEMPSCPICLFPPAAAKITKCGHIYCWSCILHYLSLGEKHWRKCPICYESVGANDLKSVVAISLKTYHVGDEITMKLMKREKGSVIVQPHDHVTDPAVCSVSPHVADFAEEIDFAKLMVATPKEVKDMILMREERELKKQLEESIDNFERSFVQRALDSLKERDKELCLVEHASSRYHHEEKQDYTAQEDGLSASSIVSKEGCIIYSSTFADEEVHDTETPSCTPHHHTVAAAENDECNIKRTENPPVKESHSWMEHPVRVHNAEVQGCDDKNPDLGDVQTEKLVTEDGPELTGQQREKKLSADGSSVYFYQAEDGQHLYLGVLNARCLIHEYGQLEYCPLTITAKILEMEHISVTQDLRKRRRHLQHLPLTCDICICELDLVPPLISSKTLTLFASEMKKNRQRREKKARDERRRECKIKEEEDRKLGIYPRARFSLQSAQHFPSCSDMTNSQGTVESSKTPPHLPVSPDSGASSSDLHDKTCSTHSAQRGSPIDVGSASGAVGGWSNISSPEQERGYRSFAQMLRDGVAKPASLPKSVSQTETPHPPMVSGSNNGRTRGGVAAGSDESEEEYIPVPHYKDAFSNAIQDALDRAAQLLPKKGQEPDGMAAKGTGGGRKNKKGRKKQLLFSTAGPRFK